MGADHEIGPEWPLEVRVGLEERIRRAMEA